MSSNNYSKFPPKSTLLILGYNIKVATKKMNLYRLFRPAKYNLTISGDDCRLIIEGQKIRVPSKRISLHQKALKITAAKIVRNDKKGSTEQEILRINYLPTIQQVRLHTASLLYPGSYSIELDYKLEPKKLQALKALGDKKPPRDLVPSIDEPEAWAAAKVVIE